MSIELGNLALPLGHGGNNEWRLSIQPGLAQKIQLGRHPVAVKLFIIIFHMDLNRVELIGRVSQLPKVTVKGDKSLATFSVATNYRYQSSSGEIKETVQFHDITSWGKLADLVGKFVKKGEKVYVDGYLRYDKWEDQGVKKQKSTIVADQLIFLSGKKSGATEVSVPKLDSDEVPFADAD